MLALTILMQSWSPGASSDDNGPTGPGPDISAPTVSSTNPANGATGVAVITASFSEAMTASTIYDDHLHRERTRPDCRDSGPSPTMRRPTS